MSSSCNTGRQSSLQCSLNGLCSTAMLTKRIIHFSAVSNCNRVNHGKSQSFPIHRGSSGSSPCQRAPNEPLIKYICTSWNCSSQSCSTSCAPASHTEGSGTGTSRARIPGVGGASAKRKVSLQLQAQPRFQLHFLFQVHKQTKGCPRADFTPSLLKTTPGKLEPKSATDQSHEGSQLYIVHYNMQTCVGLAD